MCVVPPALYVHQGNLQRPNRRSDNISKQQQQQQKILSVRWHMFIGTKDDNIVHPHSWNISRFVYAALVVASSHEVKNGHKRFSVYQIAIDDGNRRIFLVSTGSMRFASHCICVCPQYDIVSICFGYPLTIKEASDCGQWFINQVFLCFV